MTPPGIVVVGLLSFQLADNLVGLYWLYIERPANLHGHLDPSEVQDSDGKT